MIELFQSEGCPHSQKVRETLSELGVSYVIHNPRLPGDDGGDVTNRRMHEALAELGGQDQIPYLLDTARGEERYEAEDIIEYLEEHYGG